MQRDAHAYVKACDKCQKFNNLIRQPIEELIPMTAPWSFAQWGLDIMGSLPMAVKQLKFLVVGIDYFTKWVKQKPWPQSWRKMCEVLYGKISFANTVYQGYWSQTMGSSSTTTHSETFACN